jgi:hypothetical protein
MKTLAGHNILIIEENDKKKSIKGTEKKLEPFLTHLQNKAVRPVRAKRKNYFFKRLSPFLLLAAFLILLFPYMCITDIGNIKSMWLKLILFPVILINVLFADFAIWNYFQGKKRLQIWLIEFFLSVLILYLLL